MNVVCFFISVSSCVNTVVTELIDEPLHRKGLELIFAVRAAFAQKPGEVILEPFFIRGKNDLTKWTVAGSAPRITGALGKTSCGLTAPPTLTKLLKLVGKVLHPHFRDFIVNVLRPSRITKQTLVQMRSRRIDLTDISSRACAMLLVSADVLRPHPGHPHDHGIFLPDFRHFPTSVSGGQDIGSSLGRRKRETRNEVKARAQSFKATCSFGYLRPLDDLPDHIQCSGS